ncbi:TetR/AcrR family transcriptional regulator [Aeromicrobium sp. YIM 150415]|uniref:TetR/AcrR family transcriptional regulator n=1 Tax=Aeromicrobium sp. YIM 150415 TaxID=2803912 RepID=UPI001966B70D|nr:TetR/AcrR family transcriptional regulator [Aeromicrobium sp. YIM 150415]MBM9462054.1 TetR/AcrR family transcriptional regulator [Aeromicrobium sp. YIM 150415]
MSSTGWTTREAHDRVDSPRRAELLTAARSVFERLGYGAATIADITAEAGVSRATFYVYFASKAEVFAVLAEQVRDAFLEAQHVSAAEDDDILAVLRRTTGTTLEVVVEYRSLIVVLDHQSLADEDIARVWNPIRRSARERTARYLQRAVDDGRIDPVADPQMLAFMGAGMNDELAPLIAAGELTPDEVVERIMGIWEAVLRQRRR